MSKPKEGKTKDGGVMHYSAGAVIESTQTGADSTRTATDKKKYLLIDRAIPPLGFAGIAGHIDEGETAEESIFREIKEESGLEADSCELLFEEELDWNWCSKGVQSHYWYLYKCKATGELNRSKEEAKSIGWYTKKEIKELKLEPVWEYWFKKLEVI